MDFVATNDIVVHNCPIFDTLFSIYFVSLLEQPNTIHLFLYETVNYSTTSRGIIIKAYKGIITKAYKRSQSVVCPFFGFVKVKICSFPINCDEPNYATNISSSLC